MSKGVINNTNQDECRTEQDQVLGHGKHLKTHGEAARDGGLALHTVPYCIREPGQQVICDPNTV